jgi:hypothetical protein
MFQEQFHYTVALYLRRFLTYSHITVHSVKFFGEFMCHLWLLIFSNCNLLYLKPFGPNISTGMGFVEYCKCLPKYFYFGVIFVSA